MSAVVQKAGHGAFKITLNGESFLIKGLPASMLGKEVSFMAKKTTALAGGKIQLFWFGNTDSGVKKTQHAGQQNRSQTSLSKHAEILSPLPAGLKTGQTLSGHIETIQGQQMRISAKLQEGMHAGKAIKTQLVTSSISGMKEGDAIAGKVVSGANNKAMLEIMRSNPANTAKRMASFKLAIGDTATAFVQQRLANGNVQLTIQGKTVETQAPANISKGDALVLKMIKAPAGFQVLSVHKNAAATALSSFKANLPITNLPIAQNIAAMRNILPNLSNVDALSGSALPQLHSALNATEINAQHPLNGERLAQMIRDGGAGLESKLLHLSQNPSLSPALQHDLKAIMLQLSNLQSGNSHQHDLIKLLRDLGQQSVSRIESGQALNVLTNLQGEPMRLELPMLVNQQMVNVQLSIQQQTSYESESSKQSNASAESYSVLFALELSQLGHIRVDANISDSTVHARIYNDSPASNQFIQDNMQRLEARLQGLGFNEVYLLSSQQQPEASKQQAFDQLSQNMPSSASLNLVDIRI
ncbi:flagellar hook-length control protein FliK [Mariprofundus ferrooxydans]|nr:flagellar hook-length control protein FliK [Mariprofundus ferrooxydans]